MTSGMQCWTVCFTIFTSLEKYLLLACRCNYNKALKYKLITWNASSNVYHFRFFFRPPQSTSTVFVWDRCLNYCFPPWFINIFVIPKTWSTSPALFFAYPVLLMHARKQQMAKNKRKQTIQRVSAFSPLFSVALANLDACCDGSANLVHLCCPWT